MPMGPSPNLDEQRAHTVTVINMSEAIRLLETIFKAGYKEAHITKYFAWDDDQIFKHEVYEINY